MSNLATAVVEGHGAPQNPSAALSLWQAAADLGHAPAHLQLGRCSLEHGDFVQVYMHSIVFTHEQHYICAGLATRLCIPSTALCESLYVVFRDAQLPKMPMGSSCF